MKVTYRGTELLRLPDTTKTNYGTGNDDLCVGCVAFHDDLEPDSDEYRQLKAMCRDLPACGREVNGLTGYIFVEDTPENRAKLVIHLLTR